MPGLIGRYESDMFLTNVISIPSQTIVPNIQWPSLPHSTVLLLSVCSVLPCCLYSDLHFTLNLLWYRVLGGAGSKVAPDTSDGVPQSTTIE